MLPNPGAAWAPVATTYWLRIANIPAKNGVEAEVPPQENGVPSITMRYGSWRHEAANEMSGTMRAFTLGTPAPVCHEGFGKILLAPPPDAARPFSAKVSFHAASGM